MSSDQSGLEQQVQIVIFTLIINLGFYKVSEIHDFMVTVTKMITSPNLFTITIIGGAVILYFMYVISVGVGLYQSFSGRRVTKPIVIALGSFFGFYILLLMYELNMNNIAVSTP